MKRKFEKGTNDLLSEEITRKFEGLQKERKESDELKHSWVDTLQEIARKEYPKCSLVLTGSSANMFGFKHSDCDLTLVSGERYLTSVTALAKIEKLLPKSKFATELVRGAKVPVLKLKDIENLFEADINCECKRNIRHTYLLRCYALLDPRVQRLGLVIKLWAKKAGIINQKDHKLSGFTLLVLFIYYLQAGCSPPVVPILQADYPALFGYAASETTIIDELKTEELPDELKSFQSSNKQTLGELFLGFFRFYANFSWSNVVSISRKNSYVQVRRCHMRIEDPYEMGSNSARGIYEWSSFMAIKRAFSNAFKNLEDNMELDSIL